MIALNPNQLFTPCDPTQFEFKSTEELADISMVVGQERAVAAFQVGLGISHKGFNIYALGESGLGKATGARGILLRESEHRPTPDDWCYVNNFSNPAKPIALSMPAGVGKRFAEEVGNFIEDLVIAIPAIYEGEDYRSKSEQIEEQAKLKEVKAIDAIRVQAKAERIGLVETPSNFAFAPLDEHGEPIKPDAFAKLPENLQQRFQDTINQLHQQLERLLGQFSLWRKETREALKSLSLEFASYAISRPFNELMEHYRHFPALTDHLTRMEKDIYQHIGEFFPKSEQTALFLPHTNKTHPLQRYRVNLIVDHSGSKGVPVIEEELPNLGNLIGRVEHQATLGALITDFSMIKPGALHRANGGYLILDARKLLMQPYAWEALKRALKSGEIRIESLERTISLINTASLEPEPIPLQIKIVLVGNRLLHELLQVYDPEFREFFKISAEFDESMHRNENTNAIYARLIASLARQENLRPLELSAVVRVIEHSARLADDAEKLSAHLRGLKDLLIEAAYWAEVNGRCSIAKNEIQKAIDSQRQRASMLQNGIYEAISRKSILISITGNVVGQINALSVIAMGDYAFGQPCRVTATTRLGNGQIIDIQREAELSGPIHSKGVLILSGFLGSRYAREYPLSITASIVFEQSYGLVEGDSASLAELCAILSSLGGIPISQSFAITGSVNQQGQVQPIGGVNEKIEGFFDVCKELGLANQAVIIPTANVKNLMLKEELVEAVKNSQFAVYAVDTVDEALELLMDRSAGTRLEDGLYPADSINGIIEANLIWMSEKANSQSSRPV